MKIRELIDRFVFPTIENEYQFTADWDALAELLNLPQYAELDWGKYELGVHQVHIAPWLCTDTWVGLSFYTLHRKVIAVCMQPARKSSKDISFVSKEAAMALREFMLTCMKEPLQDEIPLTKMEDEIGETFEIGYASNLLEEKVIYQGKLVHVTDRNPSKSHSYSHPLYNHIEIEVDGVKKIIKTQEFTCPFRHIR